MLSLRRRVGAVGAGRTPFETSLETPESRVASASSLLLGRRFWQYGGAVSFPRGMLQQSEYVAVRRKH